MREGRRRREKPLNHALFNMKIGGWLTWFRRQSAGAANLASHIKQRMSQAEVGVGVG